MAVTEGYKALRCSAFGRVRIVIFDWKDTRDTYSPFADDTCDQAIDLSLGNCRAQGQVLDGSVLQELDCEHALTPGKFSSSWMMMKIEISLSSAQSP